MLNNFSLADLNKELRRAAITIVRRPDNEGAGGPSHLHQYRSDNIWNNIPRVGSDLVPVIILNYLNDCNLIATEKCLNISSPSLRVKGVS